MFLSLLVTVVLPIAILLYSIKLKKAKIYLLGCITFVITQVLLRLPLLTFLSTNSISFNLLQTQNPIVYYFLLALSAGIFEEFGRYIIIKLFLSNNTSWFDGVVLGLGHGEVEALLVLGLPLIVSVLNGKSTTDFLLGAIERVFAIILHVGLSVLVMKTVKSSKYIFLFMAILIHTMVDFTVGVIPMFVSNSIIIIEMNLVVVSILLLLYIFSLRKGWDS